MTNSMLVPSTKNWIQQLHNDDCLTTVYLKDFYIILVPMFSSVKARSCGKLQCTMSPKTASQSNDDFPTRVALLLSSNKSSLQL